MYKAERMCLLICFETLYRDLIFMYQSSLKTIGKDDLQDLGITKVGVKLKILRALADTIAGKGLLKQSSVKDELIRRNEEVGSICCNSNCHVRQLNSTSRRWIRSSKSICHEKNP